MLLGDQELADDASHGLSHRAGLAMGSYAAGHSLSHCVEPDKPVESSETGHSLSHCVEPDTFELHVNTEDEAGTES